MTANRILGINGWRLTGPLWRFTEQTPRRSTILLRSANERDARAIVTSMYPDAAAWPARRVNA